MDGFITIGTKLETKSFEAQIKEIEYELEQIDYELSHAKELKLDSRTVEEYRVKAEKLTNQLTTLRKKQDEINKQGFNKAISSMSQIGNSIEGIVKKVGKWAIAVFGVRSAYSAIRSAVSVLSQYDEQLSTDIEWIRYLLASTLKPIIEWLVNAVYKLLGYIRFLAQAWFNVDIFANASKKAFEKTNGAIKNTNKSAKELQKTLTGFDEMNILQKDGSTASGGGGGGVKLPDLKQINIPEWVDYIATIPQKLSNIWKDTINFWENDWEDFFEDNGSDWGLFIEGIGDKLHAFYSILKGFGEIIIGIFKIVKGALTGDFDEMGQGFEVLWQGAKDVFDGWVQWFTSTWKIVLGTVKGIFGTLFGSLGNIMITKIQSSITVITSYFKEFYKGVKQIVDGIIKMFKGDFKGGITQVFNGLKTIMLAPVNALIDGLNVLIRGINKIKFDAPDWIPIIGGKKWGFNIPKIPKLAKGGIINQPGKGVYTGSAIAGEDGRELYMPLQDEQMLSLIGEAIGKYININATVPVYVGNRQIAKEIKKINAESDFAYNR